MKLFSFLFVLTIITGSLIAAPHADQDPLLMKSIELMLHEQFDESGVLLDSLLLKYPEDPCPYFFKGMLTWRISYNMDGYESWDKKSLKYWDKTIEIADRMIEAKKDLAYAHFFKGGAHGYIGTLHVRGGSFIKAGWGVMKGINNLEESFRLDSSYYDTYYGTGLYHVVAANSSSIVRFLQKLLPMSEGNADLGVRYLQIALKKGHFSPILAQAILGFNYTYYRPNYDSAGYYLKPLVESFPRSTDFLTLVINLLAKEGLETGHTDWGALHRYLGLLEGRMGQRKETLAKWYREKYSFFDGYTRFRENDFETAYIVLKQYTKQYGKGVYAGIAYWLLGAMEDLKNNRKQAVKYYQQAEKKNQFGNLKRLVDECLLKPYSNESNLLFKGSFYELPKKP